MFQVFFSFRVEMYWMNEEVNKSNLGNATQETEGTINGRKTSTAVPIKCLADHSDWPIDTLKKATSRVVVD